MVICKGLLKTYLRNIVLYSFYGEQKQFVTLLEPRSVDNTEIMSSVLLAALIERVQTNLVIINFLMKKIYN